MKRPCAGIAQSVDRLVTGLTNRGSNSTVVIDVCVVCFTVKLKGKVQDTKDAETKTDKI